MNMTDREFLFYSLGLTVGATDSIWLSLAIALVGIYLILKLK